MKERDNTKTFFSGFVSEYKDFSEREYYETNNRNGLLFS